MGENATFRPNLGPVDRFKRVELYSLNHVELRHRFAVDQTPFSLYSSVEFPVLGGLWGIKENAETCEEEKHCKWKTGKLGRIDTMRSAFALIIVFVK